MDEPERKTNKYEPQRSQNGRYANAVRCDACGKPVDDRTRYTDYHVCGGSDGPGFNLCARKRCLKARDIPVGERRVLYFQQSAKNQGIELTPGLIKRWTERGHPGGEG